jgi:hypothetical protein
MKTVAALGISAHMGWAAVVSVALEKGPIRILRTDRIATGTTADPETVEPYHVAAGIDSPERPRTADAREIIRRGLTKQRRHTLASLRALERALRGSGFTLMAGAILCGRGRNAASLDRILASHAQIHTAEGIAVRDALASALVELGVRASMVDRDTAFEKAAATLELEEAVITATLKSLRPENGGPWRQEHKLAALAAWLALQERVVRPDGGSRRARARRR